ncbi:protein prkA, partial [bacterium]|nr:protein prkA [bacterium]
HEEERIYQKLVDEADFGDVHISPLSLQVASMFAVLSRLEPGKDQNLTMLKKMQLYDGQDVEGFTREDIKNIKADTENEGFYGVSPRYILNSLMDPLTSSGNVTCITPIDVLRSIKDNFDSGAKFTKDDIERFDEILTTVVEEYTKLAKNEVQKAFFVNFEDEIENLLENYLENVGAFLENVDVLDSFGDNHKPNDRLMRAIEEKVRVSEATCDSFRSEIFRKVMKRRASGEKFDYKSHAKLREALEQKLFDDRSDIIRLTISDCSKAKDSDALVKLNSVVDTLVRERNYTPESANALLRFVSSIFAKTA